MSNDLIEVVEETLPPEDNRLPHEILLDTARGKPILTHKMVELYDEFGAPAGKGWVPQLVYPTSKEMLQAAKEAAPYYVPKKVPSNATTNEELDLISDSLNTLLDNLPD